MNKINIIIIPLVTLHFDNIVHSDSQDYWRLHDWIMRLYKQNKVIIKAIPIDIIKNCVTVSVRKHLVLGMPHALYKLNLFLPYLDLVTPTKLLFSFTQLPTSLHIFGYLFFHDCWSNQVSLDNCKWEQKMNVSSCAMAAASTIHRKKLSSLTMLSLYMYSM